MANLSLDQVTTAIKAAFDDYVKQNQHLIHPRNTTVSIPVNIDGVGQVNLDIMVVNDRYNCGIPAHTMVAAGNAGLNNWVRNNIIGNNLVGSLFDVKDVGGSPQVNVFLDNHYGGLKFNFHVNLG